MLFSDQNKNLVNSLMTFERKWLISLFVPAKQKIIIERKYNCLKVLQPVNTWVNGAFYIPTLCVTQLVGLFLYLSSIWKLSFSSTRMLQLWLYETLKDNIPILKQSPHKEVGMGGAGYFQETLVHFTFGPFCFALFFFSPLPCFLKENLTNIRIRKHSWYRFKHTPSKLTLLVDKWQVGSDPSVSGMWYLVHQSRQTRLSHTVSGILCVRTFRHQFWQTPWKWAEWAEY